MSMSVLRKIHHLLFPRRCLLCGTVIKAGDRICEGCNESLPFIGGSPCFFCGFSKSDCRCNQRRHFYDAIVAPFYYEGEVAKGIRRLKFSGKAENADYFGEAVSVCIGHFYSELKFDYLTFVPETEDVINERGYNQSRLISESISKRLNVPTKELVYKIFPTKPQRTLSAAERVGNVLGVFEAADEAELKGKRILLIDDIKTTGSTLNECAKSLLIGGADSVFCAVAAISRSRNQDADTTASETASQK